MAAASLMRGCWRRCPREGRSGQGRHSASPAAPSTSPSTPPPPPPWRFVHACELQWMAAETLGVVGAILTRRQQLAKSVFVLAEAGDGDAALVVQSASVTMRYEGRKVYIEQRPQVDGKFVAGMWEGG